MNDAGSTLPAVLKHSRVRVVFGAGRLADVGKLAAELGATYVLLVTDPGIVRAGHAERAARSIRDAGLKITVFDGVAENPTTVHVSAGVEAARKADADFLVGLGGGSSMDCAKAVNFIFTNSGTIADYWGVNRAAHAMLPMIAIPTTAGTGSEAQSFALITDPVTHQKMACGDEKALCKLAILDPEVTATVPRAVAAATGIDAVAHAVETAGTKKRNDVSREMSREAWVRLDAAYETSLRDANDAAAREKMLLGAHLAGAAIEQSMLGAAHACANPLTARFGITHGVAVGLLLPHVVRFNGARAGNPYSDLDADVDRLARRIHAMLTAAKLPRRLIELDVAESILRALADEAATQWTAQFNPHPVGAHELHEIYRAAH